MLDVVGPIANACDEIPAWKHDLVSWRHDPSEFAYRLRRLAVDLHRTFKQRDGSPLDLIELARRIDELKRDTECPQIERWLLSAQELLESSRRR
jgi:hypothetical protein